MSVKTIMYFHGGSGNHGCEALVRTIIDICKLDNVELYSYRMWEDYKYKLDLIVNKLHRSNLDTNELQDYSNSIAISIGGDNYCYKGATIPLAKYNTKFNEANTKTMLIGCTLEKDLIEEQIEDIKKYSLITVRESLTKELLDKYEVKSYLIPDSAFILEKQDVPFKSDKEWIGINASSLVRNEITKENYKELILYIMNHTKYNVMLIPHVIQEHNDDLDFLKDLYIANNRMMIVPDCNCMELKGYISKCKMVITARTHVSIASYSMCIPTLVLGYSTKSLGIALDLFKTHQDYVIPMSELKSAYELVNGFIWLADNYDNIRGHLENIMPEYKNRCYELRELYESVCSEK